MPGLDGFEVCVKLKSESLTKHIPVIFLTAKTDAEDVVRGFKAGGADYVTQPFRSEELLARVNTHIEGQRLERRLRKRMAELQNELFERLRVEQSLRESIAERKKSDSQ
ncbi:response regulator [Desulfococcaceae bacterium HSG7]|nr:response regulator [Desulfococcaceae bacterium HSG7]